MEKKEYYISVDNKDSIALSCYVWSKKIDEFLY